MSSEKDWEYWRWLADQCVPGRIALRRQENEDFFARAYAEGWITQNGSYRDPFGSRTVHVMSPVLAPKKNSDS